MDYDRIVAVGLLTRNGVALLGPAFDVLCPVEEAPHFGACSHASIITIE